MTRREKSLFYFLVFILLLVFLVSLSGCMPTKKKYWSRVMQYQIDQLEKHNCVLDSLTKELEKL